MFSVVRGYNILLIILAQYLAAVFIFAPYLSLGKVIFDSYLFMLVLACSASIAGGYIINNFYDSEKDLINRPNKSMLDRLVSQNTKLSFYFVLNFSAVIMASYVSFRAVLFFAAYIFGIWFYSHKLKKIVVIGNVVSALLTVTPFLVLLIYYKNVNTLIFLHASFLFLLVLIRELVKDLENIKGDLTQDYKTIPIEFGVPKTKHAITILTVLTAIPVYYLISQHQVGYMEFYFYAAIASLFLFLILLWKTTTKKRYVFLHNILKFIILSGVVSILLIDLDVVINRFL